MSRFEVDDQFIGHHKTVRALRAGAEALQMWLAIRTYVAVNNSDGILPDEDVDDLPHAPKSPRKWLKVLVECGKPLPGGCRCHGLVDPIDGGWRLHDYRDHGLSPDEIERRRELSRDRQKRWREGRIGVSNASRNGVTNASRNGVSNASRDGVTNGVSNASHNALGDVPDPIRSDPDLTLAKDTTTTQDLSGCARDGTATQSVVVEESKRPRRRERVRTELSELPINELAQRWRENPTWVAESSPQSRDELVSAAKAWDEAVGLAPRVLGHPGRDGSTRALLELYADGVTHAELMRAIEQVRRNDWLCGRIPGRNGDEPRKRRIECLSQVVLRRLLDAADAARPSSVNPRVAAMLEAERKREIGRVE